MILSPPAGEQRDTFSLKRWHFSGASSDRQPGSSFIETTDQAQLARLYRSTQGPTSTQQAESWP